MQVMSATAGRRLRFTMIAAHMPATSRAHLAWTPQRLIHWGQSIGPSTAEAVTLVALVLVHGKPSYGLLDCIDATTE